MDASLNDTQAKKSAETTVSFTRMDEGTAEDYQFLHTLEQDYIAQLPDRILHALKGLDNSLSGYKISRLEHSLQTATRAEEDGADDEMIIAALVHDIGDDLAPENHSQLAAAILRPYVREEVTWVLEMHGLFQMAYYADKLGLNKDERERYRGHKWFESAERFCRDWDQLSFDPDYPTKPLEHFEARLREIFSRPAFDAKILQEQTQ